MPTIPQNYTALNEPLFMLTPAQQKRIPKGKSVSFRKEVRKGTKGKQVLVYVAEYYDEVSKRFIYVASQQRGEVDPNSLEVKRLMAETQRAAEEMHSAFHETKRAEKEAQKFTKKTGWSQPSLLDEEVEPAPKKAPRSKASRQAAKKSTPQPKEAAALHGQAALQAAVDEIERSLKQSMLSTLAGEAMQRVHESDTSVFLDDDDIVAGKVLAAPAVTALKAWQLEQIVGGIAMSALFARGVTPAEVAPFMAEFQHVFANLYGRHWAGACPSASVIQQVMMLYREDGWTDILTTVVEGAQKDTELIKMAAQGKISPKKTKAFYASPYRVAAFEGTSDAERQHLLLGVHPTTKAPKSLVSWIKGLHLDRTVVTLSSPHEFREVTNAVLAQGGHYVHAFWKENIPFINTIIPKLFQEHEALQTFFWSLSASGQLKAGQQYYWIMPADALKGVERTFPGLPGGSLIYLMTVNKKCDSVTSEYFFSSLPFGDPETPDLIHGAMRSWRYLRERGYVLDIAAPRSRLEKRDPTVLACQSLYGTLALELQLHYAQELLGVTQSDFEELAQMIANADDPEKAIENSPLMARLNGAHQE